MKNENYIAHKFYDLTTLINSFGVSGGGIYLVCLLFFILVLNCYLQCLDLNTLLSVIMNF